MEKRAAGVMELQQKKLRAGNAAATKAALDTSAPWLDDSSADIESAITVMDCRRGDQIPPPRQAPENWDSVRRAVWYDDIHTLELLLSDPWYRSTIDRPVFNECKGF